MQSLVAGEHVAEEGIKNFAVVGVGRLVQIPVAEAFLVGGRKIDVVV